MAKPNLLAATERLVQRIVEEATADIKPVVAVEGDIASPGSTGVQFADRLRAIDVATRFLLMKARLGGDVGGDGSEFGQYFSQIHGPAPGSKRGAGRAAKKTAEGSAGNVSASANGWGDGAGDGEPVF